MPSFLFHNNPPDDTVALSEDDFFHITRVLRKGKGDKISLINEGGEKYIGIITEILDKTLLVKLLEKEKFSFKEGIDIVLVQAMPRPGKMDFIIEKSTEMGVSEIIPVLTKRSWKWIASRKENRMERWKKKAHEAAKQSGSRTPVIYSPSSLNAYISSFSGEECGIVLLEKEKENTLKNVISKNRAKFISSKVHIVIGPEGGFDESEILSLKNKGFHTASLPFPILRTETAALASLAILCYEKSSLHPEEKNIHT